MINIICIRLHLSYIRSETVGFNFTIVSFRNLAMILDLEVITFLLSLAYNKNSTTVKLYLFFT